MKKKIKDNIQWNLSFGTPLFKRQGLHSGDTKINLVPEKSSHNLCILFPLFKGHLYSGERDNFSRSRNLGLTSFQGTPWHSKSDWSQEESTSLRIPSGAFTYWTIWLKSMYCTCVNSRYVTEISWRLFLCCLCWLIINKPQPNLHSGDTSIHGKLASLSLEGVPWIDVPL